MATILVVGADRGIAYCVATQLHKRGDDVIAACLGDGDALRQLGIRVEPGADVTSETAIRELADHLRASAARLDWIVHVAGVLGLDKLGSIDYHDVQRQFEINAIGPLRTIEALRDLLADGAKVGIVTSRVGSLADNGSGGMYAYRMSKAAANMAGLNLHYDLSPQGVSVLMLHPGMVATDLTRNFPGNHVYIQPEEAAAGLIRDMDELTPETSGRFRHANGEYLPW